MSFWQALWLGLVQGVTEFLPISSSGHLVLVPHLLGWHITQPEGFIFDVLVQLGTLLAVVVYFWDDLGQVALGWLRALERRRPLATPEARLGWYLILATLPAVAAGMALKPVVEQAFASPQVVGGFLLVTAALLGLAESAGRRERPLGSLNARDALFIGLAQVLALFPGVSRSGATIAAGMARHLERSAAARFSFLMAVPVMLGAGVVALHDLSQVPHLEGFVPPLLGGFFAAAVSGYLSIRWLLAYLMRRGLWPFAAYCLLMGLLVLLG